MIGHPHMFGCPAYVWMPLYVWTPPHVWIPPVCFDDVWMPPVHTQHKESMLCQTKGVSIYPIHLDAPICLMSPCMFDAFCMPGYPHMFGCTHCMFECPICLDVPCMF